MVEINALTRWRATQAGLADLDREAVMRQVEIALLDTLKRDGGQGVPIHITLQISLPKAAELLTHAHERIRRAVCGNAKNAHE